MAQIKKKQTFLDVPENQVIFINNFLIELILAIDPKTNVEELNSSGRLMAIEIESGKFNYFLDKQIPLMHLDLNLLINGT